MQSAHGPMPTPTRPHSPQARQLQSTVALNPSLGYQPEGPPVTQPSSISVSTGTYGAREGPNGGRRTAAAAIIGVLRGVCVLASALVVTYTRNRGTAPSANQGVASAEPAATLGVAPATAPTTGTTAPPGSVVEADAGAVVAAGPIGGATADPGAQAAAGTSVTTPVAKPTSSPRPQTNTKRDPAPKPTAAPANDPNDCTTPYWYDAQGVKRYKPQCLGGGK
jgi:hypothetical protein